jgi:hypothetical protein
MKARRSHLTSLLGVVTVAVGVACAPHAYAYGLSTIGARVGALDPEGRDNSLAVGGQLDFASSESRLHLAPGFIYWSNDGLSDLNPNFDLYYHFAPAREVSPYIGAGLGVHLYSADGSDDPGSDVGANLFGGVLLPAGSSHFLIEGRYAATDRSQASVFAGVNVPIGR